MKRDLTNEVVKVESLIKSCKERYIKQANKKYEDDQK